MVWQSGAEYVVTIRLYRAGEESETGLQRSWTGQPVSLNTSRPVPVDLGWR